MQYPLPEGITLVILGKRLTRAALVAGAVLAFAAACVAPSNDVQGTSTPAISVSPSESPIDLSITPAKVADLGALKIQTVTGPPLATAPAWNLTGNAETFTQDMLRFLLTAGSKANLDLTGLRYAVYDGDPNAMLDCREFGFSPSLARGAEFAKWCPDIDALLVSAPAMKDPTHSVYAKEMTYFYASAVGATLAKDRKSRQAGCNVGLMYRGIGLQQQDLAAAGQKLDLHEFASEVYSPAVVAFIRGNCKTTP